MAGAVVYPTMLLGLVVILIAINVSDAESCNEAVCASLVTKCMLLKSCECDMTDKRNCTCCKDCHRCLQSLYTECCSCVGMCAEHSNRVDYERTSTVDILRDPIPDLFDIFTSEPDEQQRWTTFTYSAHFDLLGFTNEELDINLNTGHRIRHASRHHRVDIDTRSNSMNCTVAYMSTCRSLAKCSESCSSIGASGYRWFHAHGCCECIGHTCLNYGNAEAMCLKCPPRDEDEDDVDAVEVMYEREMNPQQPQGGADIHKMAAAAMGRGEDARSPPHN